jgi:hypothetical protein
MGRARTEERGGAPQPGPGIQVFHYKDPEVEEIVRHTNKEEIRRRMSHGELLRDFTAEQQAGAEQAAVDNSDSKVFFNAQVCGWFSVPAHHPLTGDAAVTVGLEHHLPLDQDPVSRHS